MDCTGCSESKVHAVILHLKIDLKENKRAVCLARLLQSVRKAALLLG